MTLIPQEHDGVEARGVDMPIPNDDDIVIAGISGLMPGCPSYDEFIQKIYEKKNLVSNSTRWKNIKHPELPTQCGIVDDIDKFDAQFFTVVHSLSQCSEPTAKKIFEQSYQAIYDSGICPNDFSEKNVGVYVSVGHCETEKIFCNPDVPLGLIGCNRAMYANRISFWLNLKGPSLTLDASCCGSVLALEAARNAIMNGLCEAAIVGVGKLVLHPQTAINTNRIKGLNSDGNTKCYDEAADGQSMSEAVSAIFLQKYKDAKRAYAVLCHAKTGYGAVQTSNLISEASEIPRDVDRFTNFLQNFYKDISVAPSAVEYVEGYGAACPNLDKLELQAMESVFCQDRTNPLLVGSVASNIGYTEVAFGFCSILKLLSAYQRGDIAATINCKNPRRDIPALQDGRMSIVTETVPFKRTYTAVNAFSVTGINGHMLLQGCYKPKDLSRYHSDIPYLVAVSGRHENSVETILNEIKKHPLDPEEIALLHNIHKSCISKHMARGFGIYSTEDNKTMMQCSQIDYYDDARKPLWFVYSGMGSQWVGMGSDLMRIPIFADSIKRSHKVLEPKGIDLIHIITSKDKTIFNNILHSFVGIAAIQIGLTDVLTALGIVPDKIIGHSVGELGCAYADGGLTAEQMILLAYNRGLVSIQTPFIHGSMAAVGMGYKAISKICPSDIVVACHNSAESCTISGPSEAVKQFVERLSKQGVFAKEVQCSNIPYHSRYIAEAGPVFLRLCRMVVREPKLRSERWVSSSVPQENWTDAIALHSSAEYHTNNLLNTVLFEEALRHVPSSAVLVEVAPHGLLQAILKRALPPTCHHVPLTHKANTNNVLFLLEAIGKLYMQGYNPDISALYPKVEFPVSTETRPLSHLVEWAHAEKWKLCKYVSADRIYGSELKLLVSVHDDEYKYLDGHYVEGVRVFPFAAMLVTVWDTVAMSTCQRRREVSVQFSDVKFYSQPPLYDQQVLNLRVSLQKGSGRFEVFHDNGVVIDGYIIIIGGKKFASIDTEPLPHDDDDGAGSMEHADIYKMFYERGYEYKDSFRSIQKINSSMTEAQILWQDNWVTFIDGVLQTCTLRQNYCGVSLPSCLKKMVIDIKVQLNERVNVAANGMMAAVYNKIHKRTRCGGVSIEEIIYKCKPSTITQSVALKSQKFLPFFQKEYNNITTSIYVFMQMVNENLSKNIINVLYVTSPSKVNYMSKVRDLTQSPPELNLNVVFTKKEDVLESRNRIEKPDVIVMQDLLSDKKVFEALYRYLASDTFLISIGVDTTNVYPTTIYKPIAIFGSGKTRVELAKYRPSANPSNTTAVSIRNSSDIYHLKNICNDLPPQHKLMVLSSYPVLSEVKTVVEHWRKQANKHVSLVIFDKKNIMDKHLENIPDVPCGVFYDGVWGSEYYVPKQRESVVSNKCVALRCMKPGNIETLYWSDIEDPTGPGIDVTVHYAGLSVRDARRALAGAPNFSSEEGLGMDFSGVTAKGDRVMGLIAEGSASSKVRGRPELLWPVPAHWSLEDAATVPLAYAHAFYLLVIKVPLKRGMKILVHGGAGALGQAAISIALANGCTVFTTVSDQRKKHFLKKLFPELKDDHIGNSRNSSFADMLRGSLKKNSYESGCDLVISCVKGNLKNASMNCCGLSGCILDVTQLEDQEHYPFGMSHLTMARNYSMTDLSSIFKEDNVEEMRKLQLLLSDGIVRGYVRPLSRVTYEPHETARALRLLAASRHRGRVLLSMQQNKPATLPRISCAPDHSYLVICDKEGLGLQYAETLIHRGAKKLLLHCEQTSYAKQKIRQWEKHGINIETSSQKLSNKDNVMHLLRQCSNMGVVGGIYVLATDREQESDMATIVANLDVETRKFCPNMRHFAIISEDDKLWRDIIVKRVHDNLPSLSLQLQKLHKPNDKNNEDSLLWRNAVSAIEQALTCSDSIVQAYAQSAAVFSVLEEIAKIPGVNITNATVDRTRLEQVGLDEGRAKELCNMLREKFYIDIAESRVPGMTIGELKSLKKEMVDIEVQPTGFGAYLSKFDDDDMQATTDAVLLPTLVQSSDLRADEFLVDRDHLCIIPGVEGHYDRFRTLSERLKLPVAALNHRHDTHNESLQRLAQAEADVIIHKFKPHKYFYLLGYDFGVLVALEVAAILESCGMTGTVFMLGGTPEDICNSFNDHWNNISVEEMQNALILHMFTLISKTTSKELEEQLRTTKKWSDKVNFYVKALRKSVSSSIQYTKELLEGAYARIKLLQDYTLKQYNLRSNLIVLRAKLPNCLTDPQKYFPNTLKVHNLNSSLAYVYNDLDCSNIINKYLDEDILEDYDNSNQCESILVNQDEFLKL